MSRYLQPGSRRSDKPEIAVLLVGFCLTAYATHTPQITAKDFAFAFQCGGGKSCLIGEFSEDRSITLLSPDGVLCNARTKESYQYDGPMDLIPATRLDTSGCKPANYAVAWLAPEKEALRHLPLRAVEDRKQLTEIQKRVLRSPALRFNEKQWLKNNPDPAPHEGWPDTPQRDEWLRDLAKHRLHDSQFKQTPHAYRFDALGTDVLVLRYAPRELSGPLLVDLKGSLHLLDRNAAMPTAFMIGERKYLYFTWVAGEGGLIGTALWRIDGNRIREVANDSSFAT